MSTSTFKNDALLKARKLCNRGKSSNAVKPAIAELEAHFAQPGFNFTPEVWFKIAVVVGMLDFENNRDSLNHIRRLLGNTMPGPFGPTLANALSDVSPDTISDVLEQIEALHDKALRSVQEGVALEAEYRAFVEVDFLGTVLARQIPAHLVETGRSLQAQDHYDSAIRAEGFCFECPVQCRGDNKGVLFTEVFNLIGHITKFHAPATAEYADLKPVRILAVNIPKQQYRLNLPGGRCLDWRLVQKVPGEFIDF